nr:glutathione S-transferase kappa 1-like isoform X1 [Danio rerio]|eukprot:XP_021322602.1 glutathione S-transferase kappa 1-like isoform X1 [Danio rerio]
MVDNKLHYMITDLKLMSEYYGVPVNPPSPCKKDTLPAMRFVTAIAEKNQEENVLVEKVSRELWKRMWQKHQDITQPLSLTEAGLLAGLSANEVEEMLTNASSQPIKDKLKSVTQEALDKNVSDFMPQPLCDDFLNCSKHIIFPFSGLWSSNHCVPF